MYLYSKLQNKSEPIKIAFIGCGKFVSMFLAQYNQLEKIQIDTKNNLMNVKIPYQQKGILFFSLIVFLALNLRHLFF